MRSTILPTLWKHRAWRAAAAHEEGAEAILEEALARGMEVGYSHQDIYKLPRSLCEQVALFGPVERIAYRLTLLARYEWDPEEIPASCMHQGRSHTHSTRQHYPIQKVAAPRVGWVQEPDEDAWIPDFHLPPSFFGATLLHLAASMPDQPGKRPHRRGETIIQALIRMGVDIDCQTVGGERAIELALNREEGHSEPGIGMVLWLLAHGADPRGTLRSPGGLAGDIRQAMEEYFKTPGIYSEELDSILLECKAFLDRVALDSNVEPARKGGRRARM